MMCDFGTTSLHKQLIIYVEWIPEWPIWTQRYEKGSLITNFQTFKSLLLFYFISFLVKMYKEAIKKSLIA